MRSRLYLASLAAVAVMTPAIAADPIRIGVPVGLSGANSVVAPSVVQSAELAVEEINAKGGVLGRPLALDVADDGSGAAGAQKAFDALIFQKKVNVLISMETSAARNAGLPIVARGKTPFIYTSFYEGKSCSPYLYVNAWVPEQQVPLDGAAPPREQQPDQYVPPPPPPEPTPSPADIPPSGVTPQNETPRDSLEPGVNTSPPNGATR